MNTRKYPRTTLEAFGVDAETSCAIERPRKSESIAGTLLAVAIALGLVFAVYAWATEEPVNPMPQAKKQRWERAIEASFRLEKQK
jgi:hypothetical protein